MNRGVSITCLSALVALALCSGCGQSEPHGEAPATNTRSQPPADAEESAPLAQESTTEAVTSVENATPAARLTPDDDVFKDRSVFRKKYKGKVVELTGLLAGYDRRGTGGDVLSIGQDVLDCVHCSPEGGKLPWKKAVPGQIVTIRGVCPPDSEWAWDRELTHCLIVNVKGARCPELTDDQISKQFETDIGNAEKALINDYYQGYCIVRGTIASIEEVSDPKSFRAYLTTSNSIIEILFDPTDPTAIEEGKASKVGDRITVIGRASVVGAFRIYDGRLLPGDD